MAVMFLVVKINKVVGAEKNGLLFHQKCPVVFKNVQNRFRPGLCPGPRWGAFDAPPNPLVGWGGGYPLPIPYPFDVFGVSFKAPLAPRHLSPPAPHCHFNH